MRLLILVLLLALPTFGQQPLEWAQVVRVVDGDTVRVRVKSGQEVKIRLIGIDTPEVFKGERLTSQAHELGTDEGSMKKFGEQASERMKALVGGRKVALEYDEDRLDRYGRTLAYVWLDTEVMVNLRMVEEGLAFPVAVAPNLRYEAEFAEASAVARREGRGVWSVVPNTPSAPAAERPRRVIIAGQMEDTETDDFPWLLAVGIASIIVAVGILMVVWLRKDTRTQGQEEQPYL